MNEIEESLSKASDDDEDKKVDAEKDAFNGMMNAISGKYGNQPITLLGDPLHQEAFAQDLALAYTMEQSIEMFRHSGRVSESEIERAVKHLAGKYLN